MTHARDISGPAPRPPAVAADARGAAGFRAFASGGKDKGDSELSVAELLFNGPRRGLEAAGAPHVDPARLDSFVIGSSLALNFLGLALPLAVLQVYDRITANQAVETLTLLCLGLVAVAAIEFGLRLLQNYLLILDARRRGFRRSVDALDRALGRIGARDSGPSVAMMVERFNALDVVADYFSGDPRRNFIDLPFSLIFLGAMAIIGGWLALAPLIVFAVFALVLTGLLRRNREVADEREQTAKRQADFLSEIFGAVLTVKGLGAERLMLRRFERLIQSTARLFRSSVRAVGDIQLTAQFFSNVNSIATVSVGALLVIAGDLTIGGLAACSLLSGRAIQPLIRAAGAMGELQKAAVSAATAGALFETPRPPPAPFAVQRRENAAAVDALQVTLARNDKLFLDEATFSLVPGGLTALLGRDGSGRSTTLRLLAGLEEPDDGWVRIDGLPAAEARRRHGGIALVTPTVRLFHGTLLENLTLFGGGCDVADALWAMRLVGADAAIGDLPAGYDTVVGGGAGDVLSSALVRRIVLARAVAQRPRLLLLDEPHAYLDAAAEARTTEALLALRGATTIAVVTDQPGMIAAADRMVEVIGGFVSVQSGAHEAPPSSGRALAPRASGESS